MFWSIYNFTALILIIFQILFIIQIFHNLHYVHKKSFKERREYLPKVLLTIPCKGLDQAFEKNIRSFYAQDYDDYSLHFVVESESDPAYPQLCRLEQVLSESSKAANVKILIAGITTGCSQKIHNLLYSVHHASSDAEVYAFADSDVCIRPQWIAHIVHPLRKEYVGASTGYRWFVPTKNNWATLTMSILNGKIAQLLGNTRFNLAWGGSMAIKKDTYNASELDQMWKDALSDDLCLSYAVRRIKKKIDFVPACLVASYESTTWHSLFEFARRQFLITRMTLPFRWWFALFSTSFSLLGSWGALVIAFWAHLHPHEAMYSWLYWIVPAFFFPAQLLRSVLRQRMIRRLLPDDVSGLRTAAFADVAGTWFWSWLMLLCVLLGGVGRTITWRGVRYRLLGPTQVEILNKP